MVAVAGFRSASAEALSLIGRAHIQKNELERGLDYYTRSLAVSPGQIHMAIRRAELLEKMNRPDEAREQLNTYARIFPENPDILIARSSGWIVGSAGLRRAACWRRW